VGISDQDILKVREATDFVAVASEHLQLQRAGLRWKGLCPFHSEKSPSFTINPEKGLYFCFGCQAKGDVIRFVMELEHLDFAQAIERLASKAGIALQYDNETTGRDRRRRERLREAMDRSLEWYHQQLLTSPGAGKARSYLKSRGYDGDAVRQFKLGWAPDGWDQLCKALSLPNDIAKDTGLGYINRNGKLNDFFQSRILFPIFDTSGQPIAFGGRKLPDAEGPKYKNSSETLLYSKSKTLYGLNWAKQGVVDAGEVIVCEGYTDVIAFHRSGLGRAVATCGTALADDHFKMLKNFARRIVLAYDADAAGQNAAEKFYEWERRYEIDLAVVDLPAGTDPADLARSDPEALKAAVANARPFLLFRLERMLGAADLKSVEGRGRAFERAAELVREHPSPFVREQYMRTAADRCNISESMMATVLAELERRPATKKSALKTGGSGGSAGTFGGSTGRSGVHIASSAGVAAGAGTARDASAKSQHGSGEGRVIPNEDPGAPADPDRGQAVPSRRPPPRVTGRASSSATAASASTERSGKAEENLLLLVIHEPEAVLDFCTEALFSSSIHAQAFTLLMSAGDVGRAIDLLDDVDSDGTFPVDSGPDLGVDRSAISSLLQRLAVEEPPPDAEDVASLVVKGAVARVVDHLRRNPAEPAAAEVGWLRHRQMELTEPDLRSAALRQLVPWFQTWATLTSETLVKGQENKHLPVPEVTLPTPFAST
jgi:DNA primase